ncbi:DUF3267 domain-containing protein [Sunxiuqinia elliptica]|uniref:Putative zincin peptidase n=1 Tax=Sunxiuqinia elliptica TaxID=655355 RepID=A0A1I2CMY9_9BACT|nr:DUF3267 domain-containing protein [Sunxiuqinia elliptica]SFE69594.1 Putative zincin peptidase [Sunxiuqinia elliptica]
MKQKLTPQDLIEGEDFELLAEVDHLHIKQFIFEQLAEEKQLIRNYSAYQLAMIGLFIILLVKAIILSTRDMSLPLVAMGAALLFSFTLLIILHELIHALAYRIKGAGPVRFGAIWHKFIFYAAVDQQVVDYPSFRVVAWAPFVVVKVITILLAILLWATPWAYFFLGVMCIHSLFCAGDMAMLAFFRLHPDKQIFNFDDLAQQKTFFYFKKK